MTVEEIVHIQRQVIALVRTALGAVEALQNKIDSIWGDTQRLTPEARRTDVALALGEGRVEIEAMLQEQARGIVDRGYAQIEGTLGRLTAVPPEELAASERVLRAALDAASRRHELFLNLYRERHLRLADRLLIEETASGLIDALGNSDNYEFRDSWNALLEEISLARGPEEREALGHRAALEELDSYLNSAQIFVGADLTLMAMFADPPASSEDRDLVLTQRGMAESVVNTYENAKASIMESTISASS